MEAEANSLKGLGRFVHYPFDCPTACAVAVSGFVWMGRPLP